MNLELNPGADFFKKRFAGSLFPPCQESGMAYDWSVEK